MRLATCMGWSTAPFFTLLRWPIQRVQDPQICKIYSRHNINGIYRRSVTHACKSTIMPIHALDAQQCMAASAGSLVFVCVLSTCACSLLHTPTD